MLESKVRARHWSNERIVRLREQIVTRGDSTAGEVTLRLIVGGINGCVSSADWCDWFISIEQELRVVNNLVIWVKLYYF